MKMFYRSTYYLAEGLAATILLLVVCRLFGCSDFITGCITGQASYIFLTKPWRK